MKYREKQLGGMKAEIRKAMAEVHYHKFDNSKRHIFTYRTNRFFKPT